MPDVREILTELRREAEAAIAAATDAAAIEELRVHYLGRKAELTGILRGIGELSPAERGPVGSAANQARRSTSPSPGPPPLHADRETCCCGPRAR